MLCIHTNISNKPDLIIDDLIASTSHASDSELDSIVIKPLIVDTTCLDNSKNSWLNNGEKPKSKESRTQGKFVLICHNYGKIGYVRPNCYLLKSHRAWNKQVVPEKGNIVKPSIDKYVRPIGDIYLKKVRTLFCVRMLTLKLQSQAFQQTKTAYLPSLWCHRTHQATLSSDPASEAWDQRGSPSCRHCGKYGHTKAECFRVKPHKPKKNQIYEGLVNMMKSVLVRLNLDMA
jgi:hypothetical protein